MASAWTTDRSRTRCSVLSRTTAGPQRPMALLPGSAAIDAANPGCPPPEADQRGTLRPLDGDGDGEAGCDIGAFEAPGVATPTSTTSPSPTPTPTYIGPPTGTPTPTPPAGLNGDADCNGGVDSVDALRVLRYVAGLPNTLGSCPPIGE